LNRGKNKKQDIPTAQKTSLLQQEIRKNNTREKIGPNDSRETWVYWEVLLVAAVFK